MAAKSKTKKSSPKKTVKAVEFGRIYISATFNNTLINITDDEGNSLVWGSSGRAGFKGTRKSTPFAATTAVENTIDKARSTFGIKSVEVYIKGPGSGRDAALRAIKASGLKVTLIADVTPLPHNGPRQKKKRRA